MGVWQNAVPLEKEIKDRQAKKNVSDAPLERQILDRGLSGDRLEALRAPNPRQVLPGTALGRSGRLGKGFLTKNVFLRRADVKP